MNYKIVIKIGSTLITDHGKGLDQTALCNWAEQIANVRLQGHSVILVSSGAVAEGLARLKITQRPKTLHELQAAAAVGQMGLVQSYESCFNRHGLHSAQVLLTHDDLSHRKRYLNARSTLKTLLKHGVVPVVNENDTVSNEEIRFGDNDTLAALVCNLIEADLLIILTDQDGLYDDNPQTNPKARLISNAKANDPQLLRFAGPSGSNFGSGGMTTKILAAQKAARSGTDTIIACGQEVQIIKRLIDNENIGTRLVADQAISAARKQWLGSHLLEAGCITIDAGAKQALLHSGASLLPIGILSVNGNFNRGEMVSCQDTEGNQIARGLINYSAEECARIMRKPSHDIASILGYVDDPEVIHRDNMILV